MAQELIKQFKHRRTAVIVTAELSLANNVEIENHKGSEIKSIYLISSAHICMYCMCETGCAVEICVYN